MALGGKLRYPTLDTGWSLQAAFLKPVAKYGLKTRLWPWEGGYESHTSAPWAAGPRMTRDEFKLVRVASTVALGGFLVGFDATVISGAVPFVRDYFGLDGPTGSLKLGWAVSCLGWGAMGGNLWAGSFEGRLC